MPLDVLLKPSESTKMVVLHQLTLHLKISLSKMLNKMELLMPFAIVKPLLSKLANAKELHPIVQVPHMKKATMSYLTHISGVPDSNLMAYNLVLLKIKQPSLGKITELALVPMKILSYSQLLLPSKEVDATLIQAILLSQLPQQAKISFTLFI